MHVELRHPLVAHRRMTRAEETQIGAGERGGGGGEGAVGRDETSARARGNLILMRSCSLITVFLRQRKGLEDYYLAFSARANAVRSDNRPQRLHTNSPAQFKTR